MSRSKLSIKNSTFSIITDGECDSLSDTSLEVVFVGANPNLSKIWYESEWSGDRDSNTPDCFSLDGKTPSSSSVSPQNDICALCPRNAWGSKITPQGYKIKDCSDIKRVAVILVDKPRRGVCLLNITPSSLKNLNAYHKTLSMRGIAPEIAKTVLSFDESVDYPRLKFNFGGFLSEDVQKYVDTYVGSDDVKYVTGELTMPSGQSATAEDFGFSVEVGYITNKEEK
jgi:hypothetical protein